MSGEAVKAMSAIADTRDGCDEEEPALCWRCDGEGYGIIGTDWDCEDGVNGPYDGEVERCPCCGGSGKAKDCTYW